MARSKISQTKRDICVFFLQVILVLGAASVVLWLCLRPRTPNYTVKGIEVEALGRSITNNTHRNVTNGPQLNTTTGHNIVLKIEISNPNNGLGVYYDDSQVTLYYGDENIGKNSFPGFYQGRKKTIQTYVNFNGLERFHSGAGSNQTVNLKVSLLSGFRYKIFCWKTGHHKIDLQGYVTASLGKRISEEGRDIKLKPSV